jgi:hypothetical protein
VRRFTRYEDIRAITSISVQESAHLSFHTAWYLRHDPCVGEIKRRGLLRLGKGLMSSSRSRGDEK